MAGARVHCKTKTGRSCNHWRWEGPEASNGLNGPFALAAASIEQGECA